MSSGPPSQQTVPNPTITVTGSLDRTITAKDHPTDAATIVVEVSGGETHTFGAADLITSLTINAGAGNATNVVGTLTSADPRVTIVQGTHAFGEILHRQTGALRQKPPHRLGHEQQPLDAVVHRRLERTRPDRGAFGFGLPAQLPGLQVLDLHLLYEVPDAHAASVSD